MVAQMLVYDPISGIDSVQRFLLLFATRVFVLVLVVPVALPRDLICVSFLERFELQLKHVIYEEFFKNLIFSNFVVSV